MNTDIIKTLNYIKRNGPVKTYFAVKERLRDKKTDNYTFAPISEEERLSQISESLSGKIKISVLVPAYNTDEAYLRAMIESVICQTYGRWELVIADASTDAKVKSVTEEYSDDPRIVYIPIEKNLGISGNTNEGLKHCSGDYIGLLDHDDLLTNDALYEVVKSIKSAEDSGIELHALYSDEDKTNSENTQFYEANIKPKFNLDLLLSNNYICHFLVTERHLAQSIGFRSEYDGAQDHDFILRCVTSLRQKYGKGYRDHIHHIPKVLYHWRCHEESTAMNPKSKSYAYDAGKRAVRDFLLQEGITANVSDMEHVGFFRVAYEPDIFSQRSEVCAVGCRILDRSGKVKDGVYDENGDVMFKGLKRYDSGGRLHRASCAMEVPYISVLGMIPNKEASEVFKKLLNEAGSDPDYKALSMDFCRTMKKRGYIFVYSPDTVVKGK